MFSYRYEANKNTVIGDTHSSILIDIFLFFMQLIYLNIYDIYRIFKVNFD